MCTRACLIVVFAAAAGCGRAPAPPASAPPPAPAKAPAAGETTYRLKGIVQDVDVDGGVVAIAHEDIPGLMRAMPMWFTPKDHSNLRELGPGDEVEGPLVVSRTEGGITDYNLLSIKITRRGPGNFKRPERIELLKPGELVPDFEMTTQDGKRVKLSELRGNVVVLTFIYTRCPLPDYCPALDAKFRRLAERLGAVKTRAERVRLLSVSFDPEHDTPEVLRAHAAMQGARPPLWTFAVASHEELRRVIGRLGLIYAPTANQIIHSVSTAVIAPDGTLAQLVSGEAGKSWKPDDLLPTILANLPKPGDQGVRP
jgi:protein SCO1